MEGQQKPKHSHKNIQSWEAFKKNLKWMIRTNTINLIKTSNTRMIVYIATASAVARPEIK